MRVSTRIIWIAIGIVIGVFGYIGFLRAQTPAVQPARRLVVVSVTATEERMTRVVFVKDSQSGGCWLGQLQNDGSQVAFAALAPAPIAACQ
jgi:16S rRNA C1402 N4-methylase RsmH